MLKRFNDRRRAGEILETALAVALKAWHTNEKARALLGITHLYSSFDRLRAFEVADEAIKTINYLGKPDFSRTSIIQRVLGLLFREESVALNREVRLVLRLWSDCDEGAAWVVLGI